MWLARTEDGYAPRFDEGALREVLYQFNGALDRGFRRVPIEGDLTDCWHWGVPLQGNNVLVRVHSRPGFPYLATHLRPFALFYVGLRGKPVGWLLRLCDSDDCVNPWHYTDGGKSTRYNELDAPSFRKRRKRYRAPELIWLPPGTKLLEDPLAQETLTEIRLDAAREAAESQLAAG